MPNHPETTRLSSKGQVVLPSRLRNIHRWAPGTEFQVRDTPEGILLTPLPSHTPSRIDEVAGCLKTRRRVSLTDMDAAVAEEARARRARGRY